MLQIRELTEAERATYDEMTKNAKQLTIFGTEEELDVKDFMKIPASEIDLRYVSFTYGDSMPTFAVQGGKEYRGQVYTYDEILKIIDKYGLPQNWNDDGAHGPERYIEVHIWKEA